MNQKNFSPSSNQILFLPLGGTNEIGMNLSLYGHDDAWIMVDCGVSFFNQYGVDVIFPDVDFVVGLKDKFKGLVVTHGHEDHIGAIPYVWRRLKCPIYATSFTAELIRRKLKEVGLKGDIHEIELNGSFELGPFQLRYLTLTHSILEANGVVIKTAAGTVFHTGDWKFDDTPLVGNLSNEEALKELGEEGVLALIVDSTNVFEEGTSGSESTVRENLIKAVSQCEGRVVITCFASNIARLESCIRAGLVQNRKICCLGRAIDNMISAAQVTGYLADIPPFIDIEEANALPRNEVLFIATGSQGETRSQLARLALNKHPELKLEEGDAVIFSSKVIPGNEGAISYIQNNLARKGVTIMTEKAFDIHVSGHPCREELKRMYELISPKIVVPVHGEPRHLIEHSRFVKSMGAPEAIVPSNGAVISLESNGKAQIIGKVETKYEGLDGSAIIPFFEDTLRQRTKLTQVGVVMVSISLLQEREILDVCVDFCGIEDREKNLKKVIQDLVAVIVDQAIEKTNKFNRTFIEEEVKIALRKLLNRINSKNPVAYVHVHSFG